LALALSVEIVKQAAKAKLLKNLGMIKLMAGTVGVPWHYNQTLAVKEGGAHMGCVRLPLFAVCVSLYLMCAPPSIIFLYCNIRM
jgi:hypothetical protein